jgi:hypothetical protein
MISLLGEERVEPFQHRTADTNPNALPLFIYMEAGLHSSANSNKLQLQLTNLFAKLLNRFWLISSNLCTLIVSASASMVLYFFWRL